MSLRLKRLAADYERMRLTFLDGATIRIRDVEGDPPEIYRLGYDVSGLVQKAGKVVKHKGFDVEIHLSRTYPRTPPQCRMLTPIFHPNIAPHAICIGDHWAAGESLVRLALRIAEMISYQSYNLKSPLNGEAARWAEEHMQRLPVETTDFSRRDVSVGGAEGMVTVCLNCGTEKALEPCASGHPACPECRNVCRCGASICMTCDMEECAECHASTCPACGRACANCGGRACTEHRIDCKVCGATACGECAVSCEGCRASLCLDHAPEKETCPACRPKERPVMTCPKCEKRYRVPPDRPARCPACKVDLA